MSTWRVGTEDGFPFTMSDPVELTLSALVYGGEALGRLPDGRAAFVPFALPGERVRVRLEGGKRGYARAALLEVLEPAPERIPPRCAHFGSCGGCHYQHMAYEQQLAIKQSILGEQLQRIGGLEKPPVQATVPSPRAFNYRNHVQFHLSTDGRLGYYRASQHEAGRRNAAPNEGEVLPIQECHLPEPALNETWPRLDFFPQTARDTAPQEAPVSTIPGLERIGMRQGANEDIQLIMESRDPSPPEITVEELDISVVHLSPAGALVLAGSEWVVFNVLGRPFRVSAGSFFQVNTPMAGVMVEHILAHLPTYQQLTKDSLFVDAYCGVGLFSAFLAPRVGRLIGIEASPSAAEDFAVNLDEFDNVTLYEAAAELALPALEVKPDVILVDPPRQGLERGAMDGLLALEAPVLVYVSCDPATLGRDARRLTEDGYTLRQITPFDLFPQTYHIESISFWTGN